MSQAQFEIQLIASLVAVACALLGVFLVLRRMAMMSDAISHTVLLGIVIAFFITKSITSPLLLIGATLMGLVTVSLVELINRTRLVREDAAIGLVFPAIFSIAVILISRFAGDVHFDPALAAALGFLPAVIHYALMTLVSLTAVGSFDAVGSVLVVAFMIAPPAAAYLLTDRLSRMLIYSALIGIFSAISGYWLAHFLDASIAGSMATMTGASFLAAYLLAPERGLLAQARRRQGQRVEFALTMLAMHISHHTATQEAEQENQVLRLHEHLNWTPQFAAEVVGLAQRNGLVQQQNGLLTLTESGLKRAQQEFNT